MTREDYVALIKKYGRHNRVVQNLTYQVEVLGHDREDFDYKGIYNAAGLYDTKARRLDRNPKTI